MLNEGEEKVCEKINTALERLTPNRFLCSQRSGENTSVIGKPADLQIAFRTNPSRVVAVVEVAGVNTTQLVGEVSRLYFDSCPVKLLVLLTEGHAPKTGVKQCEKLFAKLYGQDNIHQTPCRVVWSDEEGDIEESLKQLLLI